MEGKLGEGAQTPGSTAPERDFEILESLGGEPLA